MMNPHKPHHVFDKQIISNIIFNSNKGVLSLTLKECLGLGTIMICRAWLHEQFLENEVMMVCFLHLQSIIYATSFKVQAAILFAFLLHFHYIFLSLS